MFREVASERCVRTCKMYFSPAQRVYVIKVYYETKSLKTVRERFTAEFPGVVAPAKQVILTLVRKFEQHYTIDDLPRSGRRSVRTTEKRDEIRQALAENPSTSSRRVAQKVGLSHTSTYRTMRSIAYPYKITVQHELKAVDGPRRLQFCAWLLRYTRASRTVLNYVYFSDEAWFNLDGFVNSQNYRVWSSDNPHVFRTTTLHPQKIGVWAAVSRKRVIGPFFFATTITSAVYCDIVKQFIAMLEEDERDVVFQQDNARPHVSKETMPMLREFFGDRIVDWPTRSPDLSPPDYFLWGMLKNAVYRDAPATIEDLKTKIEEAMNAISPQTLKRVFDNLIRRVKACKAANGQHFEHLL